MSENFLSGSRTEELVEKALALGAVQVREEITLLVDFLQMVKLRNVLEIGSEAGGTFYLWCRLAALGGLKISVDLPEGESGSGRYTHPGRLAERIQLFQSWAPRVRVITGDSHSRDVWEEVARSLALSGEQLDFLFIDGDHSYEGVKADFEQYRGFVRAGGLVGFHDINDTDYHRHRGCFVAQFWKEVEGEKVEFNLHSDWGGIGVLQV